MAAKREIPNADDLISRYMAGIPRMEILKEANISDCLFSRLLRDAGVKRRTREEACAIRAGKPCVSRQWKPDDPAKLIADYVGGESENSLSDRFSISRGAIRRLLLRNGVSPRTASEAETIKWSSMKHDRSAVERQCSAAWKAADAIDDMKEAEVKHLYQVAGFSLIEIADATGETRTNTKRLIRKFGADGDRSRIARGVQRSAGGAGTVSKYELPILDAMRIMGLEPVHQYAIGTCNVDIAFPEFRVAVEVERKPRCSSKSLLPERLKNVFDRGWKLLVIYSPCGYPINAAAVAEQTLAFLEFTRRNPAVAGEYGVVNSDGQPFTRRRFDLYGWARISGF